MCVRKYENMWTRRWRWRWRKCTQHIAHSTQHTSNMNKMGKLYTRHFCGFIFICNMLVRVFRVVYLYVCLSLNSTENILKLCAIAVTFMYSTYNFVIRNINGRVTARKKISLCRKLYIVSTLAPNKRKTERERERKIESIKN